MIKFLIIFIINLCIVLGVIFLSNLNSSASITVGDYTFNAPTVTMAVGYILSVIALMIFFKIISLTLNLPKIIRRNWHTKKEQKTNHILVSATRELLIGNNKKSHDLIKKIATPNEQNNEICSLIQAQSVEDNDAKIEYFKSLMNSKDCKFFSLRAISKIYLSKKFYAQSLEYAIKAYNINESDSQVLEVLIYCYAESQEWEKFDNMVTKLAKIDQNRLRYLAHELAPYYLKAAKEQLAANNNEQAEYYIESALELKPGFIEALDLYIVMNLHTKNGHNIVQDIIKNAFSIAPSLEIAQLYSKYTNREPAEIYDDLSSLISEEKHHSLMLSLAAYFNLPEKIKNRYEPIKIIED